jgi:hypothetical protein
MLKSILEELMAVLVEGISVLIRRDSIQNKLSGGDARFRLLIPNSTFCEDDQLARVGFLNPADVESFVDELENAELTFMENGRSVDIVICDQQRGLTTECNWLEFARLSMEDGKVSAVWIFEGERIAAGLHMQSKSMELATPVGWRFKDSLSEKFQFVPDGELRH